MRDVSDGHLKLGRVLPPQQTHQLADGWRDFGLPGAGRVAAGGAALLSRRLQSQPHLGDRGQREVVCGGSPWTSSHIHLKNVIEYVY